MLRFECDYNEGAHPHVLARLAETNMEQTPGYGEDAYCEAARARIREACAGPQAYVQFLVGGTQANTTVIAAALRPHQGVVSAATGHINAHETGAIEATGHKVLAIPSQDGKLTADAVQALYNAHWSDATHEHTVQPGMVYISHPTENGTVYTKAELSALSETCRRLGLPLFLDGARLGYGLAVESAGLTLADIAALCDVFTIGGTKAGALFGEAVVINSAALQKDFRYMIKQRGGMLAKGRLLGLQFEALFTNGLYMEISRHAVRQADRLRTAFREAGFTLAYTAPANQLFPVLPLAARERLAEKYVFSFWENAAGDNAVVRFCTSWATAPQNVDALIADIKAL